MLLCVLESAIAPLAPGRGEGTGVRGKNPRLSLRHECSADSFSHAKPRRETRGQWSVFGVQCSFRRAADGSPRVVLSVARAFQPEPGPSKHGILHPDRAVLRPGRTFVPAVTPVAAESGCGEFFETARFRSGLAFACTLRQLSEECSNSDRSFRVDGRGEESDEQAECNNQCICG